MDRLQYHNARQQLVNKYGEGSSQVHQLDSQRSQQLNSGHTGMIDASAQSAQGPIAKPVNPLSQSEIEEANWMARQIQKERNRADYADLKDYTDDPENWTDD